MAQEATPGLDGLGAKFYTSCQDTVGKDLCKAVEEFLMMGVLCASWKDTFIALVPKVKNPPTFSNFS